MSMTEAIGRMQGIQSMIAELSRPAATETSAAAAKAAAATSLATATGTGDSATFTQALAAALGGSGATDAASLTDSLGLGSSLGTSLGIGGTLGPGSAAAAGTAALTGAQAAGTVHTGGAATGNDVVAVAKKYIGVPYVWGGTNPASGMDCSGFTQRVFKDLGVELPRVVSDQMRQGTPWRPSPKRNPETSW